MPAFEITAPRISVEQEEAEREALSPQERSELQQSLYGITTSEHAEQQESPETQETIQTSLSMLQEFLQSIDPREKQAYMTAMERAPALVERESPPLAFLQCQRFNPWAAAQRLVAYWKQRQILFGDRAWQPLRLESALPEDQDSLMAAFFYSVGYDAHGRRILIMNRSWYQPSEFSRQSVLRCLFYTLHGMMQDDPQNNMSKRGFVILMNVIGFDPYKQYDRIFAKAYMTIFDCFPAVNNAIHTFCGPGVSIFKTILCPIAKAIACKELRLRATLHPGSIIEVLPRVQPYGLDRNHIQDVFDPVLSSRHCQLWMMHQLARERMAERPVRADEQHDTA